MQKEKKKIRRRKIRRNRNDKPGLPMPRGT